MALPEASGVKSCQSELSKCYHSGNNHRAGDRKCAVQHEHEEIIIIRTRIQITLEQAKLIYHLQNSQYQKTYAEVFQARKSDVKIAEGRQGLVVECGGGGGQMGVVTVGDKSQSNKEKENEKTTDARDVVCISPVSGSMYTKTVELTDLETTQE